MHTVEVALVLLLIVVVGGAFVRWTHMGMPILLVVTGVAATFLPGLGRLTVFACTGLGPGPGEN